jgi:hypothetical protein
MGGECAGSAEGGGGGADLPPRRRPSHPHRLCAGECINPSKCRGHGVPIGLVDVFNYSVDRPEQVSY